jgi:hypothetical protein
MKPELVVNDSDTLGWGVRNVNQSSEANLIPYGENLKTVIHNTTMGGNSDMWNKNMEYRYIAESKKKRSILGILKN